MLGLLLTLCLALDVLLNFPVPHFTTLESGDGQLPRKSVMRIEQVVYITLTESPDPC